MLQSNKFLYSVLAVGAIIILSSPAFATDTNNGGGGGVVSITDSTAPATGGAPASGQTFITEVSGGVVVSTTTYGNVYSIGTTNANANPKFRQEYGVWSEYSGYFQIANADVTSPLLPANMIYAGLTTTEAQLLGAGPFTTYVQKGGDDNTN